MLTRNIGVLQFQLKTESNSYHQNSVGWVDRLQRPHGHQSESGGGKVGREGRS